MFIESVMPSNHLILCYPLLFLPSIFPRIRAFSNESVLHTRWSYYWSFNFSISPSNDYSGLISFSMDWFDLLAVQGTLKSLLQHHNLKATILWHSAFFMVQLSHLYLYTFIKHIHIKRCVFSHSIVSGSLYPNRLKPTRLLCPWNFPGKNTGVGCHFLF